MGPGGLAADPLARWLAAAYATLVGAAVGSFLNVVIARVPEGESVVSPRSRCPACRRPIAWYDNVPVLSWVLLRGRCRGCGIRISPRYVVVELLGAAAGWLAWRRHGLSAPGAVELVFVAFLIALAAIDLDRWELPHELTRPLLVLGLAAAPLSLGGAPGLRSAALGAAAGGAAFWLVMKLGALLAKREAMGVGDVWLLAGLGAYLGAGALLPVVLLASIQGSVFGILLMLTGHAQPGPVQEVEVEDARAQGQPDEAAPERAGGPGGPSGPPRPHGPEGQPDEAAPARQRAPDEERGSAAGADLERAGGSGGRELREGGASVPPPEWTPPKNGIPFGPFLVLGALEWLYAAGVLARWVPALEIFR